MIDLEAMARQISNERGILNVATVKEVMGVCLSLLSTCSNEGILQLMEAYRPDPVEQEIDELIEENLDKPVEEPKVEAPKKGRKRISKKK